jgi:hypothetical protein
MQLVLFEMDSKKCLKFEDCITVVNCAVFQLEFGILFDTLIMIEAMRDWKKDSLINATINIIHRVKEVCLTYYCKLRILGVG